MAISRRAKTMVKVWVVDMLIAWAFCIIDDLLGGRLTIEIAEHYMLILAILFAAFILTISALSFAILVMTLMLRGKGLMGDLGILSNSLRSGIKEGLLIVALGMLVFSFASGTMTDSQWQNMVIGGAGMFAIFALGQIVFDGALALNRLAGGIAKMLS